MRVVRIAVVLGVLLISRGSAAVGSEPLTVRIVPRIGAAPADVVIQAYIERNASNRSVSFRVDSQEMSVATDLQIDGDQSPRVREVTFRMMPAGNYDVSVVLFGADGKRGDFWSTVSLW